MRPFRLLIAHARRMIPLLLAACLLTAAFARCRQENRQVTDDAQAMEIAGYPVALVENLSPNPKITRPEDLVMTATLLLATSHEK